MRGRTSPGSPPRTTSGCTTSARMTRAPTCARRAATGSPRSDPVSSTLGASTPPGCDCARGSTGRSCRTTRRTDSSSRSPSLSPTCRSTSRSRRGAAPPRGPPPGGPPGLPGAAARAGGGGGGRVGTPVGQGEGRGFDASLGSLPAVDDVQRAEAWGTAPAPAAPALTPELRARLERVPVAGLSQQLRKRGLDNVTIDGVRPLRPAAKLVGTARTLRFVPNREDLFASHGGGQNAQKRTFDAVGEGEVIVIEARGETGSGPLGDILAIRARARRAAGIVTDGGVRDADAVAAVGIPVYTSGAHPAVLGRKHVPWDHDLTIACGGTTVQPGDVIVGDGDGVIVIPPGIAEEVVDAALAQEDEDAWIAERVAEGHPIDGLFPMNAQWRATYEVRS